MLEANILQNIDPIYYWKKIDPKKATRTKFPVLCPLSKTQIKLPVINTQCIQNCYINLEQIKKYLNNELKSYSCPSCKQQMDAKNIIYDCGFQVILSRFDQIKNKNATYEYIYLDKDGFISFEDKVAIIKQIADQITNKRIDIITKQTSQQKTVKINKSGILEDIQKLSRRYYSNLKPKGFLFCRGKKANNSNQFTTVFIYTQDKEKISLHLKFSLKGKPFIYSKQSEIRYIQSQFAFYIIVNQARRLNIFKGEVQNINFDTIQLTQLTVLPARSFFGVAHDNNYLYILGGTQSSKTFKSVLKVDVKNGSTSNLPDMNVQRCGVKAQILNGRLYVVGGGNRNSYGPFTPVTYMEYFEFSKNEWQKIESKIQGFNFGILPTRDNKSLIIYGGCLDGNNEKKLKTYYFMDTVQNKIYFERNITEDFVKWDFDFDNQSYNQSIIRHLLVSGRQSDVTVVNFEPNYYKLKKLNID